MEIRRRDIAVDESIVNKSNGNCERVGCKIKLLTSTRKFKFVLQTHCTYL